MNVTLTPDLEVFVQQLIDEGRYRDASEVVQTALRQMAGRDAHERLKSEVRLGAEQIARGDVVTYSAELMERLKREADDDARRGTPAKEAVAF